MKGFVKVHYLNWHQFKMAQKVFKDKKDYFYNHVGSFFLKHCKMAVFIFGSKAVLYNIEKVIFHRASEMKSKLWSVLVITITILKKSWSCSLWCQNVHVILMVFISEICGKNRSLWYLTVLIVKYFDDIGLKPPIDIMGQLSQK